MHDRLEQYVNTLFYNAPKTQAAQELKAELLQNLKDKYDDLIAEGKSEQEAYEAAVSGIGDIGGLLRDNAYAQSGNAGASAAPAAQAYATPQHKQRYPLVLAAAVVLYALCVVPIFIFPGTTGVIAMFCMIAAATAMILLNRTNVNAAASAMVASAVALFILCATPNIILQNILGVILMFVMIAIGVGLCVIAGSEPYKKIDPDETDAQLSTAEAEAHHAKSRRATWIAAACIAALIAAEIALSAALNDARAKVTVYGIDGKVITDGTSGATADSFGGAMDDFGDAMDGFGDSLDEALDGRHDGEAYHYEYDYDYDDHDDHDDDHDDRKDGDRGDKKASAAAAAVVAATGTAKVPVEGVTQIETDWVAGDLNVTASDGAEIVLTETSSQQLSDAQKMRYWVSGKTLHISYCKQTVSLWDWLDITGMPSKTLTLEIPASMFETLDELELNAVSAKVHVTGVRASQLDVQSISGDVDVRDTQATKLEVETTSGKIDVVRAEADKLDIQTTSGKISCEQVRTGKLEAKSASGEMSIQLEQQPNEMDVETDSGNMRVTLPKDATDFTVKREAVSGDTECGFPSVQRDGRFVVGTGAREYEFKSFSGDLILLPAA